MGMEISLIASNTLKIKSKKTTLVIDPSLDMGKISCDGVLLLQDQTVNTSKVVDFRVVVSSVGEYEIGGIKIKAEKDKENNVWYVLRVDKVNVVLSRASVLLKIIDKLNSCDVLVLNLAGEDIQPIVSACEPKIIAVYPKSAGENIKDKITEKKIVAYAEKLPDVVQTVVLD